VHPIERLRHVARSTGAPADLLVRESAVALGAFRDDHAGLVAACRRIVDRHLTCAPLWALCARMLCAPDPMAEARRVVEDLDVDATAVQLAARLPDDATIVTVGWPEQLAGAVRRRGDVELLVVDVEGEAGEAVAQLWRMDVDAAEVPARGLGAAVVAADLVVLDASAVGRSGAIAPAGARAAATLARHVGTEVWLVAGAGRVLPEQMFDALVRRWSQDRHETADLLDVVDELVPLDVVDRVAGPTGVEPVGIALDRIEVPPAPELYRLAG